MGIIKSIIKYFTEGFAVAIAVYLIPSKNLSLHEIILISLTAGAIFAILDTFSPKIGLGTRQGAGLGIGLQHVGLGEYGVEGFDQNMNENFTISDTNVCTNLSGQCMYTSVATEDQKEKYLCTNNNNQCSPVLACTETSAGCELKSDYNSMPEVKGKKCMKKMGDKKEECRLIEEHYAKVGNNSTNGTNSNGTSTSTSTMEHFSDYYV